MTLSLASLHILNTFCGPFPHSVKATSPTPLPKTTSTIIKNTTSPSTKSISSIIKSIQTKTLPLSQAHSSLPLLIEQTHQMIDCLELIEFNQTQKILSSSLHNQLLQKALILSQNSSDLLLLFPFACHSMPKALLSTCQRLEHQQSNLDHHLTFSRIYFDLQDYLTSSLNSSITQHMKHAITLAHTLDDHLNICETYHYLQKTNKAIVFLRQFFSHTSIRDTCYFRALELFYNLAPQEAKQLVKYQLTTHDTTYMMNQVSLLDKLIISTALFLTAQQDSYQEYIHTVLQELKQSRYFPRRLTLHNHLNTKSLLRYTQILLRQTT